MCHTGRRGFLYSSPHWLDCWFPSIPTLRKAGHCHQFKRNAKAATVNPIFSRYDEARYVDQKAEHNTQRLRKPHVVHQRYFFLDGRSALALILTLHQAPSPLVKSHMRKRYLKNATTTDSSSTCDACSSPFQLCCFFENSLHLRASVCTPHRQSTQSRPHAPFSWLSLSLLISATVFLPPLLYPARRFV